MPRTTPGFFWHNLGPRSKRNEPPSKMNSVGIPDADANAWWLHLLKRGEISANWPEDPSKARDCLESYIPRDTVFAYSGGHGVVGWGVLENPKYAPIKEGSAEDVYPRKGLHLHRLRGIRWQGWTEHMDNALTAAKVRQVGLFTPRSTSVSISDVEGARRLIARLKHKFGENHRAIVPAEHPPSLQELRLSGQLDEKRRVVTRREQAFLRKHVLRGSNSGECVLCGEELPVDLLVAAHIKPRASCSDEERRDLNNIVPMCLLGCDALFERGYAVVVDGIVEVRVQKAAMPRIDKFEALRGRRISSWEPERRTYFEWHSAQTRD